jgi:hypothetical protein
MSRHLTLLLALLACSSDSATTGTGPVRAIADAGAAPQAFACDARSSETQRFPGQVFSVDTHYAAIGRLNPADAPRVTAWVCDYRCEAASCECPEGAECERVGDEVRAEKEGWCTLGTVIVRPDGTALVPCGDRTTIEAEGTVTSYGVIGARVYVRFD